MYNMYAEVVVIEIAEDASIIKMIFRQKRLINVILLRMV